MNDRVTTQADVMAALARLEKSIVALGERARIWQLLFWAALGFAIVGWIR